MYSIRQQDFFIVSCKIPYFEFITGQKSTQSIKGGAELSIIPSSSILRLLSIHRSCSMASMNGRVGWKEQAQSGSRREPVTALYLHPPRTAPEDYDGRGAGEQDGGELLLTAEKCTRSHKAQRLVVEQAFITRGCLSSLGYSGNKNGHQIDKSRLWLKVRAAQV